MEYVKLINANQIEKSPKLLRDENSTYSNPLPETLRAFGYKPLVEQEMPEDDGKYYTVEYRETETEITKVWVEYTPEEESEPEE